MTLRSCVLPEGKFVYKIHAPVYHVVNLRKNDYIRNLGVFSDGTCHENRENFPAGDVDVPDGGTVFEVPNFFPFQGVTYINKTWADENAEDPGRIRLPDLPGVSLKSRLDQIEGDADTPDGLTGRVLDMLPDPLAIALAQTSVDARDLVPLAETACEFVHDPNTRKPVGLKYSRDGKGRARARILRRDLFEVLANNPYLPDDYKHVMVLQPGAQGESEIVGEWQSPDGKSHVFEYLRSNSYIPWGHYAANMADDAIRYRIKDLTLDDVTGMRHLYYQRTFSRLAQDMGIKYTPKRSALPAAALEALRMDICGHLADSRRRNALRFNRTLWGWNFGFDFSPTGYRLHASHQQVHQQYAMIPTEENACNLPGMSIYPYACGDLVEAFSRRYFQQTGVCFFDAMMAAVNANERMDGAAGKPDRLVVYSDKNVMLFVPKAQTSQWELNLMPLTPVGNIVEADPDVRRSLDFSILLAAKVLSGLGARMITSFEYSKRLDLPDSGQRLFYSFRPRLPHSPGAFSEAQLRWINGHYPEDFAEACRRQVERYMARDPR